MPSFTSHVTIWSYNLGQFFLGSSAADVFLLFHQVLHLSKTCRWLQTIALVLNNCQSGYNTGIHMVPDLRDIAGAAVAGTFGDFSWIWATRPNRRAYGPSPWFPRVKFFNPQL